MRMNGHASYGSNETGMNGAAMGGTVYLSSIATIRETVQAEEIMRYNMRRTVSITANVATPDLGTVRKNVLRAIAEVGEPPRGVHVDVRGQLESLRQVQSSLGRGLLAAVAAIFLLLVAYFQSLRLALVSVAARYSLAATLFRWGGERGPCPSRHDRTRTINPRSCGEGERRAPRSGWARRCPPAGPAAAAPTPRGGVRRARGKSRF